MLMMSSEIATISLEVHGACVSERSLMLLLQAYELLCRHEEWWCNMLYERHIAAALHAAFHTQTFTGSS